MQNSSDADGFKSQVVGVLVCNCVDSSCEPRDAANGLEKLVAWLRFIGQIKIKVSRVEGC